jgi:hypothetical protein
MNNITDIERNIAKSLLSIEKKKSESISLSLSLSHSLSLSLFLDVPGAGVEPARPQWPKDFKSFVSTYSTIRADLKKKPEHCRDVGAENGTRTRDPDLGKVVLYQLSYFRVILGVQI